MTPPADFPPAGFWRRLLALAIDILPITAGLFVMFYYFFGLDKTLAGQLAGDQDAETYVQFLILRNRVRDLSFTIWVVYSAFADASPRHGTLGKSLMRLEVVARDGGGPLTLQQSFRRNAVKFISWLPLGLGFAWALFSKNRETWHDKISKTAVVYRPVLQ